jgi:hypothetical protein
MNRRDENPAKEYIRNRIKYSKFKKDDFYYTIYNTFYTQASEFGDVDWKESERLSKKFGCAPKNCFNNCTKIVLKLHEELDYCEGYACLHIPTAHAWLVTKREKKIIDPTYCKIEGKEKVRYFGMVLSLRDVLRPGDIYEPRWLPRVKELAGVDLSKQTIHTVPS